MSNPVSGLTSVFKSEPALVTSVIGVVIGLAASVGFHLDADQVKAIFGAITLIVGTLIRARVTPTSKLPPVVGPVAATVLPPEVGVADGGVSVGGTAVTPVVGHAGLPPQGA